MKSLTFKIIKINFVIFTTLVSSIDSYSQFQISNYNTLCGSSSRGDIGQSIINRMDGGYGIAGNSYLSPTFCKIGSYDWLFLKLNKDGSAISEATQLIGYKYDDLCYSLIQSSQDSGFVLAGYMNPTGTSQNATFVKLDKSSTYKYSRSINDQSSLSSQYNQVIYSYTTSGAPVEGGLVFAGWKRMQTTQDISQKKILITQYNNNGDFNWGYIYKGEVQTEEEAYSICYQSFENTFGVAAKTNYTSGAPTVWNILILKLSPDGVIIWSKIYKLDLSIEHYPTTEPQKIIPMADSGFAVVGFTNGYDKKNGDIIVLRVNSSGDVMWSKTYGNLNITETGYSIATNDSTLTITGSKKSLESKSDALLLKIHKDNGNVLNLKSFVPGTSIGLDIVPSTTSAPEGYAITGLSNTTGPDVLLWRVNNILQVPGSDCTDSIPISVRENSLIIDSFDMSLSSVQSNSMNQNPTSPSLSSNTVCIEPSKSKQIGVNAEEANKSD